MASSYSEKLKDPRWQRRRLEILSRDQFTCRECFSKEKTLHVHHLAYVSGKEPWDYEDSILLTLCETCHADIEQSQIKQCEELLFLFKTKLPDSFLRACLIDILKWHEDTGGFVYSLWEASYKEENRLAVMDRLNEIFFSVYKKSG